MVHNFAPANGRPVENPIGVLDETLRARAIAILRVEVVHRRQRAGWSDFEDRSGAGSPAAGRGPVQVSIASLDRCRPRICTVRRVEEVQGGECTRRRYFEDRATRAGAVATATVAVADTSGVGRPVDVSIAGLNQTLGT